MATDKPFNIKEAKLTWNYRVIKKLTKPGQYEYGIHEVYYDEDGIVRSWTQNSMVPTWPSEEELRSDFEKMSRAFESEILLDDEPESLDSGSDY